MKPSILAELAHIDLRPILCEFSPHGSVGLEGYDWEYVRPLREGVEYRMEGGIVSAERTLAPTGAHHDRVAFSIALYDGDDLCARVTNRWVFRRPL